MHSACKKASFHPIKLICLTKNYTFNVRFVFLDMLCCFCVEDTANVELIPERDDAQADYPLEDTVSVTLKRDHSIRRSQRSDRLVKQKTQRNSFSVCT